MDVKFNKIRVLYACFVVYVLYLLVYICTLHAYAKSKSCVFLFDSGRVAVQNFVVCSSCLVQGEL